MFYTYYTPQNQARKDDMSLRWWYGSFHMSTALPVTDLKALLRTMLSSAAHPACFNQGRVETNTSQGDRNRNASSPVTS